MSEVARKRATYEDVLSAPENMIAQVIDGELHLMPRPKRRNLRTASGLGAFVFSVFEAGVNGPGVWTIIFEPELHLGSPEPDILVPDLGGWRAGRLEDDPDKDEAFIAVPPDWVCEILSPGALRIDRMKKVPIYARERIPHVWLIDPREKTVEVFVLGETNRVDGVQPAGRSPGRSDEGAPTSAAGWHESNYSLIGTFGGDEALVAPPFEAVAIPPAFLWPSDSKRKEEG